MSKYYVDGYTTPDDVKSSSDVKRWQRMLGVKVDGIWGKNTQSAYEKMYGKSNSSNAATSSYADDFDWTGISEKISANLKEILRPAVDAAISSRLKVSDTNKAEIDADAAARGMEASTYVTSMKERENESREDDIAAYETGYNTTLASNLQSMLMSAYETYSDNRNAQMSYELELKKLKQNQSQFEEQMRLEREKLSAQKRKSTSSGSSSKNSNNSQNNLGQGYGIDEYDVYVKNLKTKERNKLFSSDNVYWQYIRDQIVADVGEDGFAFLERKYH